MEIKQLKTFLTVADSKSFLKAADQLYLTRQALSKTIDSLESELGVELFFRTQKGAMMTPAGIYFYPRAAQIVSEFDKLKQDTMEMKKNYKPTISICLSIGIYEFYATKIHNYRTEHSSEMSIRLRCCLEEDASTILTDKKSDAVLSFNKPSESFANTVKIGESPIVLLVNKADAAADREVGIRELPKLLYNGGTTKPLWWDEKPGKNDIISSDMSYLYTLLLEGKGVMPVPKIAVPNFLNFVMVLPVYPAPAPRPIYYSTLNPDHYSLLNYMLLETLFDDVIKPEFK